MNFHHGYRKKMQTKIVRTTHEVGFVEGASTARSLLDALKSVPSEARLIGMTCEDESCNWTMEFEIDTKDSTP